MEELTVILINQAYNRICSEVLRTPLVTNESINKIVNAKVFFKLENLQHTGSFKLRGATNVISQLTKNEKSTGVVAYSSGNHAQAVAYASNIRKIKSKIIMPKNAPSIKINNTMKYGGEIIFYDSKNESRENIALEIAKKEKRKIIKPYDDIQTIAGQGTVGKEIVEELNKINIKPDIYLCCCGGGGLLAGTSTYLKNNFPKISIYSVEPEDFNDTQLSLLENRIIENKKNVFSICDSLLAPNPGKITFPINKKILSGGLSVSDEEVKETIIQLAEKLKIVVEPGGAVAAAALFNAKLEFENKNIVILISGGNIDYSFFSNIIQ